MTSLGHNELNSELVWSICQVFLEIQLVTILQLWQAETINHKKQRIMFTGKFPNLNDFIWEILLNLLDTMLLLY